MKTYRELPARFEYLKIVPKGRTSSHVSELKTRCASSAEGAGRGSLVSTLVTSQGVL